MKSPAGVIPGYNVLNYLKEYFLYLLLGKEVLKSKLPEDLVNLIMDFKPRDRDMSSPISKFVDQQICLYEYNCEKRPDFYSCIFPDGMSFSDFHFFCVETGYPEKKVV